LGFGSSEAQEICGGILRRDDPKLSKGGQRDDQSPHYIDEQATHPLPLLKWEVSERSVLEVNKCLQDIGG